MTDQLTGRPAPVAAADDADASRPEARSESPAPLPGVARYGAALLLVAVAVGVAFAVEPLCGEANLPLIFVLPVIAAATAFGWGPSLAATVAAVLAFDFFFTEPRYSLTIASPRDIWAAALLLVIAAIVSAVAAESRRRERAARQAAEQAQALQTLAHVVIEAGPQSEIVAAAATALSRIFRAPAVVLLSHAGALRPVAGAGGAKITAADEEAARAALDTRLRVRAEAYPYPKSTFDFWPVATPEACRCVVGVSFAATGRERPFAPERFVEIVGGYLAAALQR